MAIKSVFGICKICHKEKYIANKTKFLCDDCNFKRLHKGMSKFQWKLMKGNSKKVKRKPTGELEMFKDIWSERPHICVKCGKYLAEMNVRYFSHIKSKGAFPELRLDKNNIEILCVDCHYKYEFGSDGRKG